jgi:glycerate-2-kinase
VLAALQRLLSCEAEDRGGAPGQGRHWPLERLVLLSGGTDGEDGPTDAAGAFVDQSVAAEMQARGFDPADFLRRNDAYHFFEPLGALIKTGPTHTNVCDLRVVAVDRGHSS